MKKIFPFILLLILLGVFSLPGNVYADRCIVRNPTDRNNSNFDPSYTPGACMMVCPDAPSNSANIDPITGYSPGDCVVVRPPGTSSSGGASTGSTGATTGTGQTGGTPSTGSTGDITIQLTNPFKCDGDNCTLYGLLRTIINNILLPIGGVIAVIAFIYSGFKFVMARGNETALKDAKRNLLYVAIGTAILLGAWVIANVIENTVRQLMP